MLRSVLISALFTAVMALPGCFFPKGECAYGKKPDQIVKARIVSVKTERISGDVIKSLIVDGFSHHPFPLSEDEYKQCVSKKRLKVGSMVSVRVQEGGPCPPLYSLEECL